MPIAGSPPRLSTHPDRFRAALHPPSTSALTSNPHSTRCPAGAQLPATSCLGAFWTHPPSTSALTSNPHSTRCPAGAQLPATSCLGAFWTPVSSACLDLVIAGIQKPAHEHTNTRSRRTRRTPAVRSERRPSPRRAGVGERRNRTFTPRGWREGELQTLPVIRLRRRDQQRSTHILTGV